MKIIFFFFIIFVFSDSYSQILRGKVLSSADSSALPFANIYVKNKNIGTSSDNYGNFILKNISANDTIVFSMIGFQTKKFLFSELSNEKDPIIYLNPIDYELKEIQITGENPAIALIKDCLSRKKKQFDYINSLTYSVYTKLVIGADTITAARSSALSDTVIVAILETFAKAYYKKPDLHSFEIIKRTQSANISPQANFLSFGLNLNLFEDYITILGEKIATPFHPSSLDFYNFEILFSFYDQKTLIIKLKVVPKNNLRKLFKGIVYFDASNALPLYAELIPNSAVRLPFSTALTIRQTFSHFYEDFVFPNKLELEAKLSFSPLWLYQAYSSIKISYYAYDFKINQFIDDAIFQKRRTEIANNSEIKNFEELEPYRPIPLLEIEKQSYIEIKNIRENPDSVISVNLLDKYIGGIARQIARLDEPPFTGFEDFFRYNRIQSFYFGFGYIMQPLDYYEIAAKIGYGYGDKKFSYNFANKLFFNEQNSIGIDLTFYDQIKRIDNPYVVSDRSNSIFSFLFKNDYGDYYYVKGYEIGSFFEKGQLRFIRRNMFARPYKLRIYYRDEIHSSADVTAKFSLFNKKDNFRVNPQIDAGRVRSIGAEIFYRFSPLRKLYDDGFGVFVEYSSPFFLNSDFNFFRYELKARARINTLPIWTLDILASAGAISGKTPTQKIFSLESSQNSFAQPGTFRTLNVKEFYGDKYFAFNIEHNFGEIIPGILRIPNIAEFGLEFIALANVGWTKFEDKNLKLKFPDVNSTKDKIFLESGFAINRIFIFLRVDFVARIANKKNKTFAITFSGASF